MFEPPYGQVLAWLVNIYLVILVAMSVMKVAFQFMGIVLLNPPAPALGQLNDNIWMLCALVVPFAFDLIGLLCKREQLESLHISFTPSHLVPVSQMSDPCVQPKGTVHLDLHQVEVITST